MSTIIKRLRLRAENHGVFHTDRRIMAGAADEIERLSGLMEAAEERIRQDERQACAAIARQCFDDPQAESDPNYVANAILARSRAQGGMGMGEENNETS